MFKLLVVGAGPSGLSAAIEGVRAGFSVVILEKGSLVDAIRRFPTNLVWFSTPELLEIGGVPFVIPTLRPTRSETIRYYQRVAHQYKLDIRYWDGVAQIQKEGPFFRVKTASGLIYDAENVVVATGYFDHPNLLGVQGEDLPHVKHYYDEPYAYFERQVVVIGGRNSAVEAALDLYRNGAHVTLLHRGARLSEGVKYWILPDFENRVKAGEIRAQYSSTVMGFGVGTVRFRNPEGDFDLTAAAAFVLIGFHPDPDFLAASGVSIDRETLAPVHDPETLETNVPGLFVAGSVVAGKNNNKVFVENGRLHGGVIVRAILKRRG
jgi:thioredoxin reductase (NADPH)